MAVMMMQAVRDYCQQQGLVEIDGPTAEPEDLINLRTILQSLSDSELSLVMADLQQFEETGLPTARIEDLLRRVEIMGRCAQIMPGL